MPAHDYACNDDYDHINDNFSPKQRILYTNQFISPCACYLSSVLDDLCRIDSHRGPLTRYAKLRIPHAPGIPVTFSLPPTSKETTSLRSRHASRHVHHTRVVMHVEIANPRWRGKRSRHSRRMRNPQFCAAGKRPIPGVLCISGNGSMKVLTNSRRLYKPTVGHQGIAQRDLHIHGAHSLTVIYNLCYFGW